MSIVQRKQDESDKMVFDGNPVDLDRFLAHCSVILLTEMADTANSGEKCAVIAKRLRGPALDWLASNLASDVGLLGDLDKFKAKLKAAFGVTGAQETIRIRGELEALRMQGDTLMFFTEFEGYLQTLGIHSDLSRLQILLPKLSPPLRQALHQSGQAINTYAQMRNFCVNIYVMTPAGRDPDKQRRKAKCGTCGKKGHTSGQCHSKN